MPSYVAATQDQLVTAEQACAQDARSGSGVTL